MISLVAALACLLAPSSQEDEALARGQKYLDKIGKAWAAKLPEDLLCGFYMGRQWIGSMTLAVRTAPAGSGAAFEWVMQAEMSAMGRATKMDGRALVSANLSPVSSETTETTDGKIEKKTIAVAGGRWTHTVDKGGQVTEKSGAITPGTTLEAAFLPLFGLPDDETLTLTSPDSKKGPFLFKKRSDRREKRFDGKKGEYAILELGHGGPTVDLWILSADGKALELEAGDAPIRMRPIAAAQKGKALDEPLELQTYERALIDMFLAIKKNDAGAVEACFDFDRLAQEMIPGFNDSPAEKKKEAVEAMRAQMSKNLLSEQMRNQFPDAALLEDAIATGMKSEEKEGIAKVRVFGKQVWMLTLLKEGDRKGKWVIIGISQK